MGKGLPIVGTAPRRVLVVRYKRDPRRAVPRGIIRILKNLILWQEF